LGREKGDRQNRKEGRRRSGGTEGGGRRKDAKSHPPKPSKRVSKMARGIPKGKQKMAKRLGEKKMEEGEGGKGNGH